MGSTWWFETEVKPRLQGKATLMRYCDDFLIGFEREDDARRVQAVLDKRHGALRADPASGEDAAGALLVSATGATAWDKVRHL